MQTLGAPRAYGVIGYSAVHKRLNRHRLPARNYLCITCGGRAKHWAWNHGGTPTVEDRSQNKGLSYCRDEGAYLPLCVSCHRKADAKPWMVIKVAAHQPIQDDLFSTVTVNFDGTFFMRLQSSLQGSERP